MSRLVSKSLSKQGLRKRSIVFLGHSFADSDKALVCSVKRTIRGLGFSILSGERAEARSVSNKVKERIKISDIFVALLSKRHRIGATDQWTTSPWVIEEKGYYLGRKGKDPIVIFIEDGVIIPTETGGLEGDLEYIRFSRHRIADAKKKLREALRAL